MDLVDTHIRAIEYLFDGGSSDAFNCGYGHGYSVRQVLDVARKVTGVDFPVRESSRREGDPPSLVADSSKIKQKFNWQPRHDDLSSIVKTAWDWEKKVRNSEYYYKVIKCRVRYSEL
jgi:UDP-glucose 4-epimerase